MPMLPRHLDTLEFGKVRALLRRHTSFAASAALADALEPSTDPDLIEREQETVAEARRLLDTRPGVGVRGAHDIRPHIRHASLSGSLQPWQLLEIANTMAAGRLLRGWLLREELRVPLLAQQARRILDLPALEASIRQAVDDEGAILDTASPRLHTIRVQLRAAHERLLRRLNDLLASPTTREALQEPVITLRSGRYVVPVRADFRGRVPGIVHDQSGSGATLFIEPFVAVELANRWRELVLQEQEEIERVLRELSGRVARFAPELAELVDALARVDFALARARLAEEMAASRPQLRPPPGAQEQAEVVDLRQARHPLLSGHVTPIDIRLGQEFDLLLISGPNTGGKTVALKTVGLLALMAQAGLQVPAAPGSTLAIFSGVYADIGDEQSIEQSLSTFSAHVSRIIEVLAQADSASLVLLDEIGAGTDPQEGAALGRALLGYLAERRIYTVATTHSSDLKRFAAATPRVQNASVEFDLETLRPTYRLTIGLPGQSNALTIAERLGMPREVVEAARRSLQPTDRRTERLLSEIQAELARVRGERAEAARLRQEAETALEAVLARRAAIEEERQAVLDQAQRQAAHVVAELERELDALRRQLREVGRDRRRLGELERQLAATWQSHRSRLQPSPMVNGLQVGDRVEVASLGLTGILRALTDGGDTAEIESGPLRVRAPVRDLRRSEEPAPKAAPPPAPRQLSAVQVDLAPRDRWPAPEAQLDLRGLTADEARARLDQYLSDAYTQGLEVVRVVHGKGAGVLREAVRDLVSGHPLVRASQPAQPREGGEGVTIVQLVPQPPPLY